MLLPLLSAALGIVLIGALAWAAYGALAPPPPPRPGETSLPMARDEPPRLAPDRSRESDAPVRDTDRDDEDDPRSDPLVGEVMGAPGGSALEPWQAAVRRLGLEYPGDQDREVRAAIRLVQAVWGARHGDRAQMPVASQRFAVTVALGNPERIADLMAWDARTGAAPRPALPDGGPARDDVELALAGVTPIADRTIRRKAG